MSDNQESENQNSFEEAAKPLIKWMAENAHPHTTTIVTARHAELLEGCIAITTDEFLVD